LWQDDGIWLPAAVAFLAGRSASAHSQSCDVSIWVHQAVLLHMSTIGTVDLKSLTHARRNILREFGSKAWNQRFVSSPRLSAKDVAARAPELRKSAPDTFDVMELVRLSVSDDTIKTSWCHQTEVDQGHHRRLAKPARRPPIKDGYRPSYALARADHGLILTSPSARPSFGSQIACRHLGGRASVL
jgi:hypothetical protein